MEWFRLYSEIKDDPKMLALTDGQFRLWINLLSMASESPERGVIHPYPLHGLAQSLHTSKQFLQKALRTFADPELNLINVLEDGSIVITKFDKRQPSSDSSTERVRRYRDQKQKQDVTVTETLPKHESNALDKIREDIDNNIPPIPPFEGYTENQELIAALNDFVKMRKAIKKPMTDKAKQLLLKDLDRLTSTDAEKIAIINQSIMNSWQGVFALKTDRNKSSPNQPPSKTAAAMSAAMKFAAGGELDRKDHGGQAVYGSSPKLPSAI